MSYPMLMGHLARGIHLKWGLLCWGIGDLKSKATRWKRWVLENNEKTKRANKIRDNVRKIICIRMYTTRIPLVPYQTCRLLHTGTPGPMTGSVSREQSGLLWESLADRNGLSWTPNMHGLLLCFKSLAFWSPCFNNLILYLRKPLVPSKVPFGTCDLVWVVLHFTVGHLKVAQIFWNLSGKTRHWHFAGYCCCSGTESTIFTPWLNAKNHAKKLKTTLPGSCCKSLSLSFWRSCFMPPNQNHNKIYDYLPIQKAFLWFFTAFSPFRKKKYKLTHSQRTTSSLKRPASALQDTRSACIVVVVTGPQRDAREGCEAGKPLHLTRWLSVCFIVEKRGFMVFVEFNQRFSTFFPGV